MFIQKCFLKESQNVIVDSYLRHKHDFRTVKKTPIPTVRKRDRERVRSPNGKALVRYARTLPTNPTNVKAFMNTNEERTNVGGSFVKDFSSVLL